MFRFNGFTQKANNAINVAMSEASLMGHTYIGSEHLVLGMLDENSGVAYTVLHQKNITFDNFRKMIVATVGNGAKTNLTPEDFTPRCKKALEMSIIKARMMGQDQVGTEHILMVIAKESDSYGIRILKEMGVEAEALCGGMLESISVELSEPYQSERCKKALKPPSPQPCAPGARTPTLDRYGRDLTELARADQLDPVIGRAAEVERVIQILCRRQKNNPCLIGEAGVGKTAIVEGIAQKIVAGAVPDILLQKRVVTLDLTSMVAGAKYRGDFEERIKNVLEEACSCKEIVLFIDELHTIIGAGAAEGAIDAANILKPQLARGNLQLIGATTVAEYRSHIEKDAALERRFQSIMVEEPCEEDAMAILRGLRKKYEEHHRILIRDEALIAAVTLSAKYIPDRYLPDKAIDLIDEAAARVKLRMLDSPQDISDIQARLCELKLEKQEAINTQNFELAVEIRGREKILREKINSLKEGWSNEENRQHSELTREDVAALISSITGIDAASLTQEQSDKLLSLEENLRTRVVGQQQAVSAVAGAIRRGKVGLKDPHRPIGSFIFLGPTGVGKTELCLALAESLFTRKDALIRLDMSEYMEKHTAAKLIGAPPGYIGYGEGGQLTERVRRKPYSVVLFDEVEKAHPDVLNMLLQILEDGTLTDSQGRSVSFKNTVIIMTSNLGARHITEHKTLGFSGTENEGADNAAMKKDVMGELRHLFKPEFLNRVDEIIVFNKLSQTEICEIALKFFKQLAQKALDMGITLKFSDLAVEHISKEGFDILYGARPLRRAVQRNIENKLADKILQGQIKAGENLLCDFQEDFIFVKV